MGVQWDLSFYNQSDLFFKCFHCWGDGTQILKFEATGSSVPLHRGFTVISHLIKVNESPSKMICTSQHTAHLAEQEDMWPNSVAFDLVAFMYIVGPLIRSPNCKYHCRNLYLFLPSCVTWLMHRWEVELREIRRIEEWVKSHWKNQWSFNKNRILSSLDGQDFLPNFLLYAFGFSFCLEV